MAFKGWFIGMQDGISPMVTDLCVNLLNVILSIVLALGANAVSISWSGIGFSGIALGTVLAQYAGLAAAIYLFCSKYMNRVLPQKVFMDIRKVFNGNEAKRFFAMNSDLFIRSLCFIGIYIGFTTIAAGFGDLVLASGSILMKLMMLFSYFTDGFAYAGEAMAGKFIGAGNRNGLEKTVRNVFIWSMGIGSLFILLYGIAGKSMLRIMTEDEAVLGFSMNYLPWLLLMPLAGCAAFTWDGIYIGATASGTMRNAMLWAAAGFFATYYVSSAWTGFSPLDGNKALHILLAAYLVHLVIRTAYLSLRYRQSVLEMPRGQR